MIGAAPARPRPRPRRAVIAENVRLHRLEAAVYDGNHFEIFHPWEQRRLGRDLQRFAGCTRVLDVAAGTGNVVAKLQCPVRVALDLSPEMLARLVAKDGGVLAVVGLAEALPFRDGAFDAVLMYSAVHHTCDLQPLAEMRHVTRLGGTVTLDHEEAFREPDWRATVYGVARSALRFLARTWYWRRPAARRYDAYRSVWWPHSASFDAIDFALTDGGQPDPVVIEAELRRLGMTVQRRHYLLEPLPMVSWAQGVVDRLCRALRLGHFSIDARR